jgi:S-adenosylmethionine synthetase
MQPDTKLFTSESVTEGHPDKIADAISDAVLDNLLEQDCASRVACETLVSTGLVVVAGEITTSGYCDIDEVARNAIRDIGYDDSGIGFDYVSCGVITSLKKQSLDIDRGVSPGHDREQGAGDQGMMFGFACDETPELMPLPICLAHRITRQLALARKDGTLPFLRPDGKAQVTVRYEGGSPVGVDTIIVSAQHAPEILQEMLREAVIEEVVKKVVPPNLLHAAGYHINPTGRFVIGGPCGDCGLTGRKIIADTYGGYARHGGGAFSGKDPSKVDRSAAYMARYAAKNIVAAGLARRCEIEIAYAIGIARPVSLLVDTFGTGLVPDADLTRAVSELFDFRPAAIIETLGLLAPLYRSTTNYGHFGRSGLPWETTDRVSDVRAHFHLA